MPSASHSGKLRLLAPTDRPLEGASAGLAHVGTQTMSHDSPWRMARPAHCRMTEFRALDEERPLAKAPTQTRESNCRMSLASRSSRAMSHLISNKIVRASNTLTCWGLRFLEGDS